MFRTVAKFMTLMCLLNIFGGSVSFAISQSITANPCNGMSQAESGASERLSIPPCEANETGLPGECDDESCASHQCHVGHCAFHVEKASGSILFPALSQAFTNHSSAQYLGVHISGPKKPPRA